jgi:DNA-binding protein
MEDASSTERQKQDNVVFIGRKPTMSYVLACMTIFQRESTEVTLKARGRAINTAVDVAEIMRNRFMTDLKVKDIHIGTDVVPRPEGQSNVSTIEITLTK